MPMGISDVASHRFVGLVWVILCSVITVLHSDVPIGTYCSVSRYPFPLEDAGIRYIYIYNE